MQNASPNPPIEIQPEPLTVLDRPFWAERGAQRHPRIGVRAAKSRQTVDCRHKFVARHILCHLVRRLKRALPQCVPAWQWTITGALVLPLACWLVALFFAIRVFIPQLYTTNLDSRNEARDTYAQIAASKHAQLRCAHLAGVLGFVPFLVNVVLFWRV